MLTPAHWRLLALGIGLAVFGCGSATRPAPSRHGRVTHRPGKRPSRPTPDRPVDGNGIVSSADSAPSSPARVRSEPDAELSVPIPAANAKGCISPDRAASFEKAIEAEDRRRFEAAMGAAGYALLERQAHFLAGSYGDREPPAAVGGEYQAGDRRMAFLGWGDGSQPDPKIEVASKDGILFLTKRDSRVHEIEIEVCGVAPCVYGRGAAVRVSEMVMPLGESERMGGELEVETDEWAVLISHQGHRDCGPPPP